MANTRWAMEADVDVVTLLDPTLVADATPLASADTALDLRDFPGHRALLLVNVDDDSSAAAAVSGLFTIAVQDAADDGTGAPDSWATAVTHGSLTPTDDSDFNLAVALFTQKDRPFVRVTATGDDANANGIISAYALLFENF